MPCQGLHSKMAHKAVERDDLVSGRRMIARRAVVVDKIRQYKDEQMDDVIIDSKPQAEDRYVERLQSDVVVPPSQSCCQNVTFPIHMHAFGCVVVHTVWKQDFL